MVLVPSSEGGVQSQEVQTIQLLLSLETLCMILSVVRGQAAGEGVCRASTAGQVLDEFPAVQACHSRFRLHLPAQPPLTGAVPRHPPDAGTTTSSSQQAISSNL